MIKPTFLRTAAATGHYPLTFPNKPRNEASTITHKKKASAIPDKRFSRTNPAKRHQPLLIKKKRLPFPTNAFPEQTPRRGINQCRLLWQTAHPLWGRTAHPHFLDKVQKPIIQFLAKVRKPLI